MSRSSHDVLVETDNQVTTITLNRPEARNAVNIGMLQRLEDILDELHANRPRAVVLTAASPGFCGGIDLKESREASPEFAHERVSTMHRVLAKLRRLPVPVIGAIDGAATGLGCELAISADIRLISPASRFSYPELKVAVPSPAHHLIWLIGLAHAQDMLLTARWVDAQEADRIGLATRIVDDVVEETHRTIENILSLAPVSLQKTKENIWLAIDEGANASSKHHVEGVTAAASTADRREALAAFAEKRAPRFTGS